MALLKKIGLGFICFLYYFQRNKKCLGKYWGKLNEKNLCNIEFR